MRLILAQCGLKNDLIQEVLQKKRHILLADYEFLKRSSGRNFAFTTSKTPKVLACSPYIDHGSAESQRSARIAKKTNMKWPGFCEIPRRNKTIQTKGECCGQWCEVVLIRFQSAPPFTSDSYLTHRSHLISCFT